MMKSFVSIACFGLAIASALYPLTLYNLPASANERVGPRGSSSSGDTIVSPNRQGGYNIHRQGSFDGANGGSGNSQIRVQTNGETVATYSGSGSFTTPAGQSLDITTSGSGSYNSTSGYSGQNTTTVNSTPYSSTTQDGSTTLTTPDGSRTFDKQPRR